MWLVTLRRKSYSWICSVELEACTLSREACPRWTRTQKRRDAFPSAGPMRLTNMLWPQWGPTTPTPTSITWEWTSLSCFWKRCISCTPHTKAVSLKQPWGQVALQRLPLGLSSMRVSIWWMRATQVERSRKRTTAQFKCQLVSSLARHGWFSRLVRALMASTWMGGTHGCERVIWSKNTGRLAALHWSHFWTCGRRRRGYPFLDVVGSAEVLLVRSCQTSTPRARKQAYPRSRTDLPSLSCGACSSCNHDFSWWSKCWYVFLSKAWILAVQTANLQCRVALSALWSCMQWMYSTFCQTVNMVTVCSRCQQIKHAAISTTISIKVEFEAVTIIVLTFVWTDVNMLCLSSDFICCSMMHHYTMSTCRT